jgi:hypothetical protein
MKEEIVKNKIWYGVKSETTALRGIWEKLEQAEKIAEENSKTKENSIWKVVSGDMVYASYQNGKKIFP